jgi:hypothetical protein
MNLCGRFQFVSVRPSPSLWMCMAPAKLASIMDIEDANVGASRAMFVTRATRPPEFKHQVASRGAFCVGPHCRLWRWQSETHTPSRMTVDLDGHAWQRGLLLMLMVTPTAALDGLAVRTIDTPIEPVPESIRCQAVASARRTASTEKMYRIASKFTSGNNLQKVQIAPPSSSASAWIGNAASISCNDSN